MAARRGLCAGREPDRKSRDHLLFGRDRRPRCVPLVGALDMAFRHPLDALLHTHSLTLALPLALTLALTMVPSPWCRDPGAERGLNRATAEPSFRRSET